MILSNLTIPLLGVVDTAILGHLSDATYLGAVALGAIIFDMLFWAFGFLRMGTTALSAQAYGAANYYETLAILYKSLLLAVIIGCLLVLLQKPLLDLAFWYMAPTPRVEEFSRLYCDIRIYAAPAALCDYVIIGWLLSVGKPRKVLVVVLITNLTNLILDYWLVVQMGMLTDGVALGSLISSLIGMIVGLYLVSQATADFAPKFNLKSLYQFSGYLKLLQVNRYLFVRTLCLLFSFSFFYAQSAQQTTATLSANSIIMTMLMVFAYGADGFANAAEVLIGKSIGAKRLDHFYSASRAATFWFFVVSTVYVAIAATLDRNIIGLLTDIEPVIQETLVFWPWLLVLPFVASWNFMLDGIFLGAGKARAMQYCMLVASLFVFLPSWYLARSLGNHGLWLAFCFFHAARTISMAMVYYYYSKYHLWIKE